MIVRAGDFSNPQILALLNEHMSGMKAHSHLDQSMRSKLMNFKALKYPSILCGIKIVKNS